MKLSMLGWHRPDRLAPPRWRAPRRGSLLRAALVAALLALAAGTALTSGGSGAGARAVDCQRRQAPTGTPSPDPRRPLPVPAGQVGVPVRLADPAVTAMIRPGDRVDLLAGAPDEPAAGHPTPGAVPDPGETDAPMAAVTVADVLVLAAAPGPDDQALLYLAMTEAQARRVAAAPTDAPFSVTVRPR